MTPIQSLIQSGGKIWLDSVDPQLVLENRRRGLTGATSNPLIIAGLLETGHFDDRLAALFEQYPDDAAVAWAMTDRLVSDAQKVFAPVWEATQGDDGYVSFELDPLLEDPQLGPPPAERTRQYITLGQQWARGHSNRLIKVPATPAGLAALEDLTAAGVRLNVTLIFTMDQYFAARDAVWRGIQRCGNPQGCKSVFSVFVSRVDAYTAKHVPTLSPAAQGMVGIVNARRMWRANHEFWAGKNLPLHQEMIFASTGTKDPADPKDKYVAALAGSDIQTNPPETNDAVEATGKTYQRTVDQLPPQALLDEIDAQVDWQKMHAVLMDEGVRKFADPFKKLLTQIAVKRRQLATTK